MKNFERILILQDYCSLDLSNEINQIGKYINKIGSKITVTGQVLDNQFCYEILKSIDLELHQDLFSSKAEPIIIQKLGIKKKDPEEPQPQ